MLFLDELQSTMTLATRLELRQRHDARSTPFSLNGLKRWIFMDASDLIIA